MVLKNKIIANELMLTHMAKVEATNPAKQMIKKWKTVRIIIKTAKHTKF